MVRLLSPPKDLIQQNLRDLEYKKASAVVARKVVPGGAAPKVEYKRKRIGIALQRCY